MEEVLFTIPGLNFTVIRPGIVYGIGDRSGISRSCYLFYTNIYQRVKSFLINPAIDLCFSTKISNWLYI